LTVNSSNELLTVNSSNELLTVNRSNELLTASNVGRRLGVDTSTIYRMAADGRLPAVKVGRQWRFPRDEVERVLTVGIPVPTSAGTGAGGVAAVASPAPARDDRSAPVPADLADTITGLVAEALGVMMTVTDMGGRPVTGVANPCPWFADHGDDPGVLDACVAEWRDLATDLSFAPAFRRGPQGFRCARAFIRHDHELVGMVLAGGLGPTRPADADGRVTDDGFFHLDAQAEARVLQVLPHVAAALSSV
jgi:excisionase family DNA binding protein